MSNRPDALRDDIVKGFNADLPAGCQVRLDDEEPDTGDHWWTLAFRHRDGHWSEGPGYGANRLTLEYLVILLGQVQDELIEHDFRRAWPECPVHGVHPLEPEVEGWHCSMRDKADLSEQVWEYGSLHASH